MAVPKDHETFEYEKHKQHILFNGTQMLQGRPEGHNDFLKAVVIRTGLSTLLFFKYILKKVITNGTLSYIERIYD